MRLQDMTFDLDKARVDAAYVGNICLTYEEWPETDNDMQYILAAVYDLEPALDEIERQAARIKELEEANRNIDKRRDEMAAFIERLEAAFLKARQCPTCKGEGTIHPIGQPIDSICPKCLGDPESMAREALERIKAETGSGDHVAGANKLILTAEQREALEHVIEYVQETQMPISNLNEFDMQELRSLLTGSKPAWEVTEERIAAMKDACNFLVYAEIRNKGVNPGGVDRAKNAEDVLRGAGGKDEA